MKHDERRNDPQPCGGRTITLGSIKEAVALWNMRVENADMLDALLWHLAGMDLLTDAA